MNILRERYNFHHRHQKVHETIEDFASELRRLAASCQFNEYEESFVRDHVLFGLRNQSITIQIVESGGDPNLVDVIQTCMVLDEHAELPNDNNGVSGKKLD